MNKIKLRLAAILAAAALPVGIGLTASVAHATPPPPTTTWSDSPYEGNSPLLFLAVPYTVGQNVEFLPHDEGTYVTALDYQVQGSAGGDSYYWIHPAGHDTYCMTASTTQFGVIKSEPCKAGSQYYWFNYEDGSSRIYWDASDYWAAAINDPNHNSGGAQADLVGAQSYGNNGYSLQQLSA